MEFMSTDSDINNVLHLSSNEQRRHNKTAAAAAVPLILIAEPATS
jgi:hypothetical protein